MATLILNAAPEVPLKGKLKSHCTDNVYCVIRLSTWKLLLSRPNGICWPALRNRVGGHLARLFTREVGVGDSRGCAPVAVLRGGKEHGQKIQGPTSCCRQSHSTDSDQGRTLWGHTEARPREARLTVATADPASAL